MSLENSSSFSFQNCEGDTETLFIDLALCENGNCGENSSLKVTVVTAWRPACVLSVRYWWLLWTGLLHECPFTWQDWQDIERGQQMFVLPAWQKLFDARLILQPEMATWFLSAGSNRIPRSLSHSSIKTKALPNTRSEVSAKLKLSQNCEGDTLHWFDPLRNGNCGENGSLTVVTAWHLHVCSLFGTGDYCGVDCWTNAHSMGKTGKTLNEGNFLFFQHGKSCLMLGSFSNRKRQPDSWWLVAIGFLEACHTAASGTKQFSQHKVWGVCQAQAFSKLRRRQSSLIWPFAKKETV